MGLSEESHLDKNSTGRRMSSVATRLRAVPRDARFADLFSLGGRDSWVRDDSIIQVSCSALGLSENVREGDAVKSTIGVVALAWVFKPAWVLVTRVKFVGDSAKELVKEISVTTNHAVEMLLSILVQNGREVRSKEHLTR